MKTNPTTRRMFLRRSAALALAGGLSSKVRAAAASPATIAEKAAETANDEMWRRQIDRHRIVLDYTELDGTYERPTPEECRLGKPKAVFMGDWRRMNAMWQPQRTDEETHALAMRQLAWVNEQSPRRSQEMRFVREPLFAAWIVTLCPDCTLVAPYRTEILNTLAHFRYAGLRYSQFFPAESAWWRLQGMP